MRMPGQMRKSICCTLILIAVLVSTGLLSGCESGDSSLSKIDLVQKIVNEKSLSAKIVDSIAYAVSEELERKAHVNFGPDMEHSVAWMEYWMNAQWHDFAGTATVRDAQPGATPPAQSSAAKYGIDVTGAQVWIEFYGGEESEIPENERSRVAYAELDYRDGGWQVVKVEQQAGVLELYSLAISEKGLKRSAGK